MTINKKLTSKYYIQGIDCPSCELSIPLKLKQLPNIDDAVIPNNKNVIFINYVKNPLTTSELNKIFHDEGYTFSEIEPLTSAISFTNNQIAISIVLISIITALFILFEEVGFTNNSLSSDSSFWAYFTLGIIASISTCAALIGGMLIAISNSWIRKYPDKATYFPIFLFLFGRIISFIILGGLLGFVGSILGFSMVLNFLMTILISILMILFGLQMIGYRKVTNLFTLHSYKLLSNLRINKDYTNNTPFIAGFITFFIPCGFTLIAQSSVILTNNFWIAAYLMFGFVLGTIPMLIVLGIFSVKLYKNKNISNIFNLSMGVLIILFSIHTIYSQLNLYGLQVFNPNNNKTQIVLGDKTQIIELTASEFDYSPNAISIAAGVPTRMIINNEGTVGCATSLYAPGLYNKVVTLKSGKNEIEIPNPQKGTYKISCSMGMVDPVTVTVL